MWHYNYTDTLYHGNYGPTYIGADYSDDLAHYGVLGMKWGIRKQRESSGSRVGGRRQLSAKTKKRLKKLAIGAGIGLGTGAAVAGGVLLARKGIPALKAAKLARGLNGSQLQAMSLSGNKFRSAAANKEIYKRAGKSLKEFNKGVISKSTNAELGSMVAKGSKLAGKAERELGARGVRRMTSQSKLNRANAAMPWNKNYKEFVSNPTNAWIKGRQNANIATYNKAVTRGNAIRTGLVGAGLAGAGAGGAYAGYNAYKKKKNRR